MIEKCKCIEYSWKWVTASELLSLRPCELCNIILSCEGGACNAVLYDGRNTNGRVIMDIKSLEKRAQQIPLHDHIYCNDGLYVYLDDDVRGLFVQWLETPQGIGYPKE